MVWFGSIYSSSVWFRSAWCGLVRLSLVWFRSALIWFEMFLFDSGLIVDSLQWYLFSPIFMKEAKKNDGRRGEIHQLTEIFFRLCSFSPASVKVGLPWAGFEFRSFLHKRPARHAFNPLEGKNDDTSCRLQPRPPHCTIGGRYRLVPRDTTQGVVGYGAQHDPARTAGRSRCSKMVD